MAGLTCFIHVATINNYQSIVNDFIDRIRRSGLDKEARITFYVCGPSPLDTQGFPQVRTSSQIEPGEFLTLNALIGYCKTGDDNVMYIHTKGVTSPNNECINDWRRYMSYFMIDKYKDCIAALNSNDTCGVDLRQEPCPHYSGNFWWATSPHIQSLRSFTEMPVLLTERHKAEFWIGQHGKHHCLWDCGINQFQRHLHRYGEENYVRNPV